MTASLRARTVAAMVSIAVAGGCGARLLLRSLAPATSPEEDLVPLPVRARPANWSTRDTARKKLKKRHRKR